MWSVLRHLQRVHLRFLFQVDLCLQLKMKKSPMFSQLKSGDTGVKNWVIPKMLVLTDVLTQT